MFFDGKCLTCAPVFLKKCSQYCSTILFNTQKQVNLFGKLFHLFLHYPKCDNIQKWIHCSAHMLLMFGVI